MLRRLVIAIALIVTVGVSFIPTDASAHWRGGWGWGVGAGFLAGALIGGALARPYYYVCAGALLLRSWPLLLLPASRLLLCPSLLWALLVASWPPLLSLVKQETHFFRCSAYSASPSPARQALGWI